MMPRKLLVLTYAFPPLSAPESYLSAKTCKDLPGFEVDILCASEGLLPADRSLNDYVKSFRKVIRVSPPRWMQWLQTSSSLSRVFFFWSLFPDKAVYLNRSAREMAFSMMKEGHDILLTWSQFHSAHLVALELKKQIPKLRWVAHFSDPWVDNPFNRFSLFTKYWNEKKERMVVESADHLIFTSSLTVNLVMKKYPAGYLKKVSVIPHPFDETLYPKQNRVSSSVFVFRYLGKFYGQRNPKALLRALKIVEKENPVLLKKMRFEFIGGDYKTGENFDEGLVSFLPPVDYQTSLRLMQSANVLLVIDAPMEQAVFLPSKLIDYLGAKRPIMGITSPGTSRDLIESMGWRCFTPDNPREIADGLVRVIADLENGSYLAEEVKQAKIRQRYSAPQVRQQMVDLLEGMIALPQ